MSALNDALLGEVARAPLTVDELADRVNHSRADVRSALAELCWVRECVAPDRTGRYSPATPEQVKALRSV